jgi:hypothetical protein
MQSEKIDFLSKLRIRQIVLLGLITITAVVANLPREYVENTLAWTPTTCWRCSRSR